MENESIKTYSYRISQASRSELIVIMYDMAVEYLSDAADQKQPEKYCMNIRNAKRVIDELCSVLDMKYELSVQLYQLYQFMGRKLIQLMSYKDTSCKDTSCKDTSRKDTPHKDADAINDKEDLLVVMKMLKTLRASFYEVSKTDQSGPLMNNVQQVYAGYTYSNVGNSNEFTNDPSSNRGFRV